MSTFLVKAKKPGPPPIDPEGFGNSQSYWEAAKVEAKSLKEAIDKAKSKNGPFPESDDWCNHQKA